jgi:hypothetical protein
MSTENYQSTWIINDPTHTIYNTNFNDVIADIKTDSIGNSYIVFTSQIIPGMDTFGLTSTAGIVFGTTSDPTYIKVMKVDSAGNVIWVTSDPFFNPELATEEISPSDFPRISIDRLGNSYVTYSVSPNNIAVPKQSSIVVFKLDPNGKSIWVAYNGIIMYPNGKTISNSQNISDNALFNNNPDIATDFNGNSYVVYTRASPSVPSVPVVVLLKLNSMGRVVWSTVDPNIQNSSYIPSVPRIDIDCKNNIVITFVRKTMGLPTNVTIATAQFTSEGVFTWLTIISNGQLPSGFNLFTPIQAQSFVATTADGYSYVAYNAIGPTTNNSTVVMVSRLKPNGSIEWTTTNVYQQYSVITKSGNDIANYIVTDFQGNAYVA